MKRPPFAHIFILTTFLVNTFGPIPNLQAQEFRLPAPGIMVHLSPPLDPPILKGLKVYPDNPLHFDFILDKGDMPTSRLRTEATKLIKYFLATLTIPEKDLWVNLSPYEKDRIIPQSFGLTEMGRDLLAEDYMLKQITASLIYPEDRIGKKFWKRVYEEAAKKFGTTNIPVNTFNKVWIVPEKAVVYENAKAGTAYVVESKLKVMLEQDYLAMSKHQIDPMGKPTRGHVPGSGDVFPSRLPTNEGLHLKAPQGTDRLPSNTFTCEIIREVVIPELTKEVNENKNFTQLRQVYNSLILAAWYKKKIKDSILAQVYANQNKIKGTEYAQSLLPQRQPPESSDVELIYQRYLQAFKKGVFNYIKEDAFSVSGMPSKEQEKLPRKYFSGGLNLTDFAQLTLETTEKIDFSRIGDTSRLLTISSDFAMASNPLKTVSVKQKLSIAALIVSILAIAYGLSPNFQGARFINSVKHKSPSYDQVYSHLLEQASSMPGQKNQTYSGNQIHEYSDQLSANANNPTWRVFVLDLPQTEKDLTRYKALYLKMHGEGNFIVQVIDGKRKDKRGTDNVGYGYSDVFHVASEGYDVIDLKSILKNQPDLNLSDTARVIVITGRNAGSTPINLTDALRVEQLTFSTIRPEKYNAGVPFAEHVARMEKMNHRDGERSKEFSKFAKLVSQENFSNEFAALQTAALSTRKKVLDVLVQKLDSPSQEERDGSYHVLSAELYNQAANTNERRLIFNVFKERQLSFDENILEDYIVHGPIVKKIVVINAPYFNWDTKSLMDSYEYPDWNGKPVTTRRYIAKGVKYGVEGTIISKNTVERMVDANMLKDWAYWARSLGRELNIDIDPLVVFAFGYTETQLGITDSNNILQIHDQDTINPKDIILREKLLKEYSRPGEDSRRATVAIDSILFMRKLGIFSRLSKEHGTDGMDFAYDLQIYNGMGHNPSLNNVSMAKYPVIGERTLMTLKAFDGGPLTKIIDEVDKTNGYKVIPKHRWSKINTEKFNFSHTPSGPARSDKAMKSMMKAVAGISNEKIAISIMKFGQRNVEIRYPSTYQYEGQEQALNINVIKTAIETAINDLQNERSDFDISPIKGIEIIDDINHQEVKRAGVAYVPLQTLLSDLNSAGVFNARVFRNELIKFLIYHAEGEALGDTAEQLNNRDLQYLADDPGNLKPPHYQNVKPADYHIVVPVFNEGKNLELILPKITQRMKGHLDKITFVDDASTDNGLTRGILERYEALEGIKVLYLKENKKKEGAIREVLEIMNREGKLPDKIILLDSDSVFDSREKGKDLQDIINQASAYMDDKNIAGLALRVDELLPERPNLLEKLQYAEYTGVRWWNRMSSKQGQLWVINGPGGMFRGNLLLDILRNMQPDFETGDLLITVNLMKRNYQVGYYNDIVVKTIVPNTIKALFKQRQRWERGTTKVLVNERGFYLKQFKDRKTLPIQTILQLSPPLWVLAALISVPTIGLKHSIMNALLSSVFWMIFSGAITLSEPDAKNEKDRLRIIKWYLLQGLVTTAIITPARLTGFYEAVKHFILNKSSLNKNYITPFEIDEFLKEAEAVSSNGQDKSTIAKVQNLDGIDLIFTNLDLKTQDSNGAIKFHLDAAMVSKKAALILNMTAVALGILLFTGSVEGAHFSRKQLEAGRFGDFVKAEPQDTISSIARSITENSFTINSDSLPAPNWQSAVSSLPEVVFNKDNFPGGTDLFNELKELNCLNSVTDTTFSLKDMQTISDNVKKENPKAANEIVIILQKYRVMMFLKALGWLDHDGAFTKKFESVKTSEDFKKLFKSSDDKYAEILFSYLNDKSSQRQRLLNKSMQKVSALLPTTMPENEFEITRAETALEDIHLLDEAKIIAMSTYVIDGREVEVYFIEAQNSPHFTKERMAFTDYGDKLRVYLNLPSFLDDVKYIKKRASDQTKKGDEILRGEEIVPLDERYIKNKSDSKIYFDQLTELLTHELKGHGATIPEIDDGTIRYYKNDHTGGNINFLTTSEIPGLLAQTIGSADPARTLAELSMFAEYGAVGGKQYTHASWFIVARVFDKMGLMNGVIEQVKKEYPAHTLRWGVSTRFDWEDVYFEDIVKKHPKVVGDLQKAGYLDPEYRVLELPLLNAPMTLKLESANGTSYTLDEKKQIFESLYEEYSFSMAEYLVHFRDGGPQQTSEKFAKDWQKLFLNLDPQAVKNAARQVFKEYTGKSFSEQKITVPNEVIHYVKDQYFSSSNTDQAMNTSRLINDVEPIETEGSSLLTSSNMNEYIEEPLRLAVKKFYDLNIMTFMSTANMKNVPGKADLTILLSSLSDKNQEIAKNLGGKFYDGTKVSFSMPLGLNTTVSEVEKYFLDIANKFTAQPFLGVRNTPRQLLEWMPEVMPKAVGKEDAISGKDVATAFTNAGGTYGEYIYSETTGFFYQDKEHLDKDESFQKESKTGGIDLTPDNMNLQTKVDSRFRGNDNGQRGNDNGQRGNDNGGIKFYLDPAMLQQLQDAPGFVPVIINISPLKDLPVFLGVSESSSLSVSDNLPSSPV
ncbi:MAG: glycosyltransferase family 2 protein [Candidatus Omnitrophica bacterium]|nr:glycosyltransferase family 2 protein [Candidatus Omnitrophota bacterium]